MRVVADVGETQGLRVADQLPKHAPAAWQAPDRPSRLLVDAGVDEALQAFLRLVEDPEGRVAGARQLAGGFDHVLQHDLDVELGEDPTADLDQPPEAVFGSRSFHALACQLYPAGAGFPQ